LKQKLKILISCVFYAVTWPFRALAEAIGLDVQPRLIILYYHDVPEASRAGFARQMDWLMQHATVVGADWRGGETKGRHCAITFDDAFVSAIVNALPELEKRQLPCTMFVPAGPLGKPPDWAMETNHAENEVVATREVIKSLPSSLVTVGAHTVSHPYLSRIPRDTARVEIELSRAMLSEMTGQDVRLLSFPYGDYDEQVTGMCKDAGYEFVFGIEPKSVDVQAEEFVRGRVAVQPDDGRLQFFLKMSGGYNWMPVASSLKRAVVAPFSFLGSGKPAFVPDVGNPEPGR
jgi:peptidoglycan/xylan/chitin deacetylase (PgdA/CDA1 family)